MKTLKKIETSSKINEIVENFRSCYNSERKLSGSVDGEVTSDVLLSFLVERPELIILANELKEVLNNE